MRKNLSRVLSLLLLLPSLSAPAATPDRNAYALTGARVIAAPGQVFESGVVVVRGGVIEAVGPAGTAIPSDASVIDVSGKVIHAAFVDPYVTTDRLAGRSPKRASDEEGGQRRARVRDSRRRTGGALDRRRPRRDSGDRESRSPRRRRRRSAETGFRGRGRRSGDRRAARPGRRREPGGRPALGTRPRSLERPGHRDARPRRQRLSGLQHGRRGRDAPGLPGRPLVARRRGGVQRQPGRPRAAALRGLDGGARAGRRGPRGRRLRDDRRAFAPARGEDRPRPEAPGPLRRGGRRVPAAAGGRGGQAGARPARRLSAAGQARPGRGMAGRLHDALARVRPRARKSAVAPRRRNLVLDDDGRPREGRRLRGPRARGHGTGAFGGRRPRVGHRDPGAPARPGRPPGHSRSGQDRQPRRPRRRAVRGKEPGLRDLDRRRPDRPLLEEARGSQDGEGRRSRERPRYAARAGPRGGAARIAVRGRGARRDGLDAGAGRHPRGRRRARGRREDLGRRPRARGARRRSRDRRPRQARDARNHRRPLAHGHRRPNERRHAQHHFRSPHSGRADSLRSRDLSRARGRHDGGERPARLGQLDRRPEPDRQVAVGRRSRRAALRRRARGDQVRARREPEAVQLEQSQASLPGHAHGRGGIDPRALPGREGLPAPPGGVQEGGRREGREADSAEAGPRSSRRSRRSSRESARSTATRIARTRSCR